MILAGGSEDKLYRMGTPLARVVGLDLYFVQSQLGVGDSRVSGTHLFL